MKEVFPHYRDLGLDDFEALNPSLEKAVTEVRGYIDRLDLAYAKGLGLTLVGPNGVGKTMLACCVLSAAKTTEYVPRRPHGIECIELSSYMEIRQDLFKLTGEDEQYHTLSDQLRRIRGVHFLLLDDLGREHESVSGWSNEMVFDLLRYRYNRNLPTLLTTNIPIENPEAPMDLKRRYSEGMSSHLLGSSIIVQMEGEDYRATRADRG